MKICCTVQCIERMCYTWSTVPLSVSCFLIIATSIELMRLSHCSMAGLADCRQARVVLSTLPMITDNVTDITQL